MKYIFCVIAVMWGILSASAGECVVTVTASPEEGGTVTGNGTCSIGDQWVLTASPNVGWTFTGWSDGNKETSHTITVLSLNVFYVATFAQVPTVTISVVASPAEGGSVTGSGTYLTGSQQTITATPNNGWYFSGWSDGNQSAQRTITVSANQPQFTAIFAQPDQVELFVSADPADGGVVTGSGTYSLGSQQTITATPNLGWLFTGWSDGNQATSRTLYLLTDPTYIVARFIPLSYPPSITKQPVSQTVFVGTNVTFSVTATGTEPLSYQWWKGTVKLAGATNASLVLTNTQLTDIGSFKVDITSPYGNASSTNVTLTVLSPPIVTQDLVNQSVVEGGNVDLTVGVTGSEPIFYQWWYNGGKLTGVTNATLPLSNVQTKNAGSYGVAIWNAYGKTQSVDIVLTVLIPPTIVTQPQAQSVSAGSSVTLTVAATGTGPLTYEWWFNGNRLADATNATLTLNDVQANNAGIYGVIVRNSAGKQSSDDVTLTVTLPPAIATPPTNLTVVAGNPAAFIVTATGSAPLRYQWWFNGYPVAGATNATYTISEVQPENEGIYGVVVSNDKGQTNSPDVTLTVLEPPVITKDPKSQTVMSGDEVTFSVAATGKSLQYQWLYSASPIAGATNATYVIQNVKTNHAGAYSVTVSNPDGTTPSATALLKVNVAANPTWKLKYERTGNLLVLSFDSTLGYTYTVQYTDSLKNSVWTDDQIVFGDDKPMVFSYEIGTNTQRIYRLKAK
jgi:hypothetical protein